MRSQDNMGPEDMKELPTMSRLGRRALHEPGLDRLLNAINSFPRLATEGVDYKPLHLVVESAEQPRLRYIA